ncbi:hypothetical protein ACIPY5_19875 [Microbacterium sp. NPDC089698]|uniref:hypothetical protein n=1 Tax=Microbacterium sp. NPDC089698 TaxID=3364200 RepID=UPI00382F6592
MLMGPDGWGSIGDGFGSIWNTITGAWKAAGDAAAGIGNAVSFATDPIGFLTNAFGGAAKFILATVIPWALKALTPDFTSDWFLKQYSIVFSVAILVWGLVFMIGLVRKRLTPTQVADMIVTGSPAFFVGCLLAPWGMFVVGGLIMTITNALAVWMTGQNVDTFVTQVGTLVTNGDTLALLPEPLIALGLILFLLLSACTMFLVLLMGLVVSYMTGGLFPLAWVWITLPETRRTAWLMVLALIGIWCAPVLIILAIGIATQMSANVAFQATQTPGDAMAVVLAVCVPAIGMLMASLAPMMLGVMAATRVSPAGTAGLSSGFGRDNLVNRLPQPSSKPKSAGDVASTPPAASPTQAPSTSPAVMSTTSPGTAVVGSEAATAAAGTGAKAATGAGAATANTAGAAATAGVAGTGAAGGAGAAGATAAAGTGATATGVGAAVGVPLLVGAAVLAAANGGKQKARAFASALAEMGQM